MRSLLWSVLTTVTLVPVVNTGAFLRVPSGGSSLSTTLRSVVTTVRPRCLRTMVRWGARGLGHRRPSPRGRTAFQAPYGES
jgi:hypothetical protein